MQTIPSIACCVIAKNEIENINTWFESIDGCFDEIHFVDTGSTDGTIERAKELGLTVHHFEWVKDFSKARNFAFDQAKTDYIFWNDLDDVLSSKSEFNIWRKNVMNLADMWFATYNYACNEKGEPVCQFARERVIKNGIGLKWKYFIHEGILPVSHNRPLRVNAVKTWHIHHRRTQADLAKDRSRNLDILEQNKDSLDARLTYYYGKELFENGKEFDAIEPLTKVLRSKELQPHDRVLATQYVCYSLMKCNQFQKAISLALTGVELFPQRAEFFVIIGDCYIKLNRPLDAAPFYKAAKECNIDTNIVSPIFSSSDQYNVYPSNQLSRIYANTNRIDLTLKESKETFDKFRDKDSETLYREALKVSSLSEGYKSASSCDEIVFTTLPQTPYKWDANLYKTRSMGGSETACIEMAYWLAKKSGKKVIVFNPRDDELECDGVLYRPINQVAQYMSKHKPWLHIAWRHNFKMTDAPTFVWSHDLITQGVENICNYNKVMALTQFHKDYLHISQGIPYEKIWVTRNGVNPDKFTRVSMDEKDPFKFVFSSSPDRGLDRAMLVLDRVREVFPKVTLNIYYGRDHLDKYGLGELKKKLDQMVEERKDWIYDFGATEQMLMYEHFRKASFCVQPSDFIETSKITSREMLYCGVYQITRAVGGVCDTMKDASENGLCSLVSSDCITEVEYKKYIDETIKAVEEQRYKRLTNLDPNEWSWEKEASRWLIELPKMF